MAAILLAGTVVDAGAAPATPARPASAIARLQQLHRQHVAPARLSRMPQVPRASTARGPLSPTGTTDCTTGWAVVSSLNEPGANSILLGASAVSASDLWSVGWSNTGGTPTPPDTTLAEHWNGSAWALVNTPNPQGGSGAPGTTSNDLNGVAAFDASNVWAVGMSAFTPADPLVPTTIATLAIKGNTGGFNPVASNNPGSTVSELFSVAEADATHVFAVGTYDDTGSVLHPLVLAGDGSTFATTMTGLPAFGGDTVLNQVVAVSATELWVSGYTQANNNAGTPRHTLVLHWVGGAWTQVATANPLVGDNLLATISRDPAGDIWAAGYSTTPSNGSQTLIERYNGTSFVAVASPSPATGFNDIAGVVAINANSAWAVGDASDATTGAVFRNLIEHWDGSSWKTVKAPDNGPTSTAFAAVVALSQQNVWAVGAYIDGTNNAFTLTANECVAVPAVTAVSPGSGPVTGGTAVVVTGTSFTTASGVSFGATAAASFRVDSDTQITAFAPSHVEGPVTLQVTNWGGSSSGAAGNQYTYEPFVFTPSPIAPDGSLKASQAANGTMSVKNPDGTNQAASTAWLSFAGLGSATANGTPLTATPSSFITDLSGNIAIVYTAPSLLPSTIVTPDSITAQNAATSPTEMAQDTYTFSRSFYFAEGYTGCNFSESLSILMPNNSGNAFIDYYTPSGHIVPTGMAVTAGTVAIRNVNADVPAASEVSARVTLPMPGVVERTLHFINCGNWKGSTDVVGVTQPSTEWDFAEGSTLSAYSEFLTLQNPNRASVSVSLQYFTDIAGVNPLKQLVLPGNSRTTIVVNNGNRSNDGNCTPGAGGTCGVGAGIGGVSVKITSDGPIIAERPFYVENFNFGSGAIRDGHDAFGANAPAGSWYFAEGNTLKGWNEYLTLQNPNNAPAPVDLNYFTNAGAHIFKTITLPATSRTTVLVFGGSPTSGLVGNCTAGAGGNCGIGPGMLGVSITVVSRGGPIVAERPMYMVQNFGTGSVNGAHVAVGATQLSQLFGFAIASTTSGENDYLTILNSDPVNAATITLKYYATSGYATSLSMTTKITRTFTIPPNTRHTVLTYSAINPGDQQTDGAGPGYFPVGITLQSDVPVLVEKPAYSSSGASYGATDTLAYSPSTFLLTP